MQTRNDPLPCGVRHWKVLTDQNSSFKNGGEGSQDSRPFWMLGSPVMSACTDF